MPPLTFRPLIKRIRWGGTRLGTLLAKPIGDATDAAESWEIADHGDDQTAVAGGPHDGRTLRELIVSNPEAIFGPGAAPKQFPLLIKFLDANDRLSVQVHPNDEQAKRLDPDENGKTEAWVIVSAEPGSKVYAGLKPGVSEQQLLDALSKETVEDLLHAIDVQAGDVIFIPAGTVHAIAEGIVLAEVQQQSDATYRLYDWGRVGADGQPRELHIEESLAVIDWNRGPVTPRSPMPLEARDHQAEQLVTCKHFTLVRRQIDASATLPQADGFRVLMILAGQGGWSAGSDSGELRLGQTLLIPAECDTLTLWADEPLTLLEASEPSM